MRDHESVAVPSCVSSGKSYVAGGIIPWWLHSHFPARVFTIAPTERQLEVNLWGEFTGIYGKARQPLGGRPLALDWVLEPKRWYAKGFAPKDALNAFGVHGPNDLFIFDDGQGIDPAIFEAFENAFAGGTAKRLILYNPVSEPPLHGSHVIRISAFDTPNVRERRAVVPGLITAEKVQEWISRYGNDSDFVRVKVYALPPKQGADTLIPLEWLELARLREVPSLQGDQERYIGVDVARFGNDLTVAGMLEGRHYTQLLELSGADTMEVSGRIVNLAIERGAHEVNVDDIGIGAGVTDRVTEVLNKRAPNVSVTGVNVAEKPMDEERFANLRSEVWWAARESLDPANPAVLSLQGCDQDLIADLSSLKYKVDSAGRIAVERKEDTKKRLGRSPDRGDAYSLAVFRRYAPRTEPAQAWSGGISHSGTIPPDWA